MCWCDSSIKTPCCGKPECFPKEGKSKIQIIKQQIEKYLQLLQFSGFLIILNKDDLFFFIVLSLNSFSI